LGNGREHVHRECVSRYPEPAVDRIWVRILKIPYQVLFPLILLFCIIGTFSITNNLVDVSLMILFGVIGYFFADSITK